MTTFSRRYGYDKRDIQLECVSDVLKRRIWARFYKEEFMQYDIYQWGNSTTGIEDMMIEMGVSYEYPSDNTLRRRNASAFEKYLINAHEWYTIFDFIEKYLAQCDSKKTTMMRNEFNRILEEEVSAYRIVKKQVVPITNESELKAIGDAIQAQFDPVNKHISKALELYADRRNPDYENSIKESISAVESLCCIITGITGKGATLGNTIKHLKDKGIHIHPAMESAFSSLYGYTNDEGGIRHGSMEFKDAPAEDAKYMLVSCSAFVNYLIEKWSKVSSS